MSETPLLPLLTTGELAALLMISKRHVCDLLRAGKLPPPVQMGGRWKPHLWRRSDIEKHLDELARRAG